MSANARDHAGVLLPPPLVYLGVLVAGLALQYFSPLAPWAGPFSRVAGLGLVVAGLLLSATAAPRFRRAGTALRPNLPTTALVTSGPYRYSRNPLYLSATMVVMGAGLALGNAWILLMLVPAMILVQRGIVQREEEYLEAKFGDTYREYRARVRRWV